METNNSSRERPLLIYNGDCGFCTYWARYWQKLTHDKVDYAPYQQIAAQYPHISAAEFQRAVQYIASDGSTARAAEATFLTLSHAHGRKFWLTLYRRLPGFAALSEHVYAFVAARRPLFHRLSLWLWGLDYAPPRFERVSGLFLRLIGLIYFAAFVSFGVQALGLIGGNGILPLPEFISALNRHFGAERYWLFPMLFWLGSSNFIIQTVCWAGAMLSLLVMCNVLPRLSLFLLYAFYLSLFYAGQDFMTFQWDLLLLESGFLALLLAAGSKVAIWLLRWLLFRFMFLSGTAKLLGGDPNWANFSALNYHFMTQPLPTPLAWYAHYLPPGVLAGTTVLMFLIELVLPFLIFCPRRLRFAAAFGFLLLQITILLTGNYNFFNLLTMALCLCLFDDLAFSKLLPRSAARAPEQRVRGPRPGKTVSYLIVSFALLIVLVSGAQLYSIFSSRAPAWARDVSNSIAPLRIVNAYGLFAVMTTERPEIVIEGSMDGDHWTEYSFKYKPGDVARAPAWNIPHQPRLDWQMWFAALEGEARHPWFGHFLQRLLENSPQVTAILAGNPFVDKPPRYVRALLYDYRYAGKEEKKNQGLWWERRLAGLYYPPVEFRQNSRSERAVTPNSTEGKVRPRAYGP